MRLKSLLPGLLVERASSRKLKVTQQDLALGGENRFDPNGFEPDDTDYPQDMLDHLAQNGVDISGFSVAIAYEGTENVSHIV